MSQQAAASRPRTPPIPSEQPSIPPEPEVEPKPPQRKSSFSFLRRGKSTEKINGVKRSTSTGKLQKRSKQVPVEPVPIPTQPPIIPDLVSQPKIEEFGGESAKKRLPYNVPIPRVPAGLEDAYARPDSVTHRGRYSYASSAVSTLNSPRRVRRRKDPTPFNILIVGARNSGKTAFGEFLRASLALPARKQRQSYYGQDSDGNLPIGKDPDFQSEFLETEIGGERIGLTVWDSEGLEKNVVDLQIRRIVTFIESKFDETLTEETKVIRSPIAKDPHIHCVILVLDPSNLNKTISDAKKLQDAKTKASLANGKPDIVKALEDISPLDEHMDLQVLRALQNKTTVIPVISKADTITSTRMKILKRSVYKELKAAKLDPFEALGIDENDEDGIDYDSDSDVAETPQRHNHRRFREADEDKYRAQHDHTKSTFDLSDSSSENSVIHNVNGAPPSKESEDSVPPLPLSVLTPDPITTHQPGIGVTSREFPWGSADPYDPNHCDFVRFKEAVFQEWFVELREASRELWYEGWRTSRLNAPRARSTTLSTTPVPDREPTIPVLAMNPGNTPSPALGPTATKQPSRNVSGVNSTLSPINQQQQSNSPSLRQYSPSQQQRSNPHSPAFSPPHELSASPVPSYRASPQLLQRLSPQASQTTLNQKQAQIAAQQLLQQQQQQSRQRGYSPFQQHPVQQGRKFSSHTPPVEEQGQEVGVAR